jgi:hypothetical protein
MKAQMRDLSIGIERRAALSPGSVSASLAARLQAAASALKQSCADGSIFLPLIAAALWVLTHPYQGIIGDAAIYVGRALADLDPSGVGRDMAFVDDGQSRFSLFPLVLDRLVATFGTQTTAMGLAVLAMAAWIAALCLFARQYVAARFIAVVVIFVAVLPVGYGTPWRFAYSQVLAVPRPFAEALVLAALAALAGRRTVLPLLLLVAATLIHPLMALAGWAVFGFVLCREDWRWRVVFAAGAALVVAGALLGVPVVDRLVTIMDPGLKAFAESRSALLFPTAWPAEFIGGVAVEATTIAIAASFFEGRRRMILIGAIFAGISGIAAQAFFGDTLSLLLVIQAQLWRMAWLLAATGAIALAIASLKLWRQGPRAHVVLAILAIAWLSCEESAWGALICLPALAVHFGAHRIRVPIGWTMARIVWAVAIALAFFWNIHYLLGYAHFVASMPADAPRGLSYFWTRRYLAFPILALVLALVFTQKRSRLLWAVQCAVAVLLIAAALRLWDERPPLAKLIDSNRHPPELMQLIAGQKGEVLWIDGLAEAWFLTGRPQWASRQQGVSTIFSRELTLKWRERMQFLIDQGLAEKKALLTAHFPAAADLPKLSHDGVGKLCARADAPAFIVAPVWEGTQVPPEFKPQYWRLDQPNFRMTEEAGSYGWTRISAYAVLPCAPSWRR